MQLCRLEYVLGRCCFWVTKKRVPRCAECFNRDTVILVAGGECRRPGRPLFVSAPRFHVISLARCSWAEVMVLITFICLVALWLSRDPKFVPGWSELFEKKYVSAKLFFKKMLRCCSDLNLVYTIYYTQMLLTHVRCLQYDFGMRLCSSWKVDEMTASRTVISSTRLSLSLSGT